MTKQDQVILFIKKLYESNKIKDGDLIPSENFIMNKFSFSRNTVREALKKIANTSIIIPIQGKGYIFNESSSYSLKSFEDKYGEKNSSTIYIMERFVDHFESDLKVNGYYEIVKVRYKGKIPFILTYQRIAPKIFNKLKKSIYSRSMYDALNESGADFSFAKKTVEIIKTGDEERMFMPSLMDEAVLLTSLTTNSKGVVIEKSLNYYPLSHFRWTWVEKYWN